MGIEKIAVCRSDELADRSYRIVDIAFRGKPHSAIVLRYRGKVHAYLNQCVHMVRRLDCERDAIFDADHERLRCSMHGIVYDPQTGESLSTLCAGDRLTPLRVQESDGLVALVHKHVTSSRRAAPAAER